MYVVNARNVNDGLSQGIALLKKEGKVRESRVGITLEMPGPVATTYERPWERVLFSPIRDANPFFHLMEALWILGGRNDVKWISEFNSKIHEFSDDGMRFHGAYGFRLRFARSVDQLAYAIKALKENGVDRRVVLQIWDTGSDLGKISKDIPCNDLIFLKVRGGKLQMTVCCRSNDIIWGCYGANMVHFSILQEYLAGMIGVGIGTYTQVSDSYHAYTDRPDWGRLNGPNFPELQPLYQVDGGIITHKPLITNSATFDDSLRGFLNEVRTAFPSKNSFFFQVAEPMRRAWRIHKTNRIGWSYLEDATQNNQKNNDWIKAGLEWLARRER